MSTNIQWTDETWNPIRAHRNITTDREYSDKRGMEMLGVTGWHCEHVSEGCRNCYAETLNEAQRFDRGTGLAYTRPNREKVDVYLDEKTLTQPLRWRKPRKVFVASMTDLFGEWVTDEMLDRVFAVMALTPHITYQVLTKRPERMRAYLTTVREDGSDTGAMGHKGAWFRIDVRAHAIEHPTDDICHQGYCEDVIDWPLPNVWLGTSVEDQPAADKRIPELLATPAAVRFLSCEPLLGPVDLVPAAVGGYPESDYWAANGPSSPRIDWVICGGESGPKARPFDVAWGRSLRRQCAAADVAVFVKQLGAKPVYSHQWGTFGDIHTDTDAIKLRDRHGGNPDEWPADLRVREFPGGVA